MDAGKPCGKEASAVAPFQGLRRWKSSSAPSSGKSWHRLYRPWWVTWWPGALLL